MRVEQLVGVCLTLSLVSAACAGGPPQTTAQPEPAASIQPAESRAVGRADGRYYAETGHTLDPLFVDFYDLLGGPELLGYPITESFIDPHSGLLIQYFENARLELVPDQDGPGSKVRLAELGVLVGGWDLPQPGSRLPIGSSPNCRYYEQSGHQVCHAFLEFYEAHGGPDTFGLPTTEFRVAGDRVVQYFEKFRLDWTPETGSTGQIRVGPLGQEHFDRMGYGPALLAPVPPGDLSDYRVLQLRLNASVSKPLVSANEAQSIYLTVSDQNFRPVEGAATLLTIRLPDAPPRFEMLPLTDQNGVTRAEVRLEDLPPGTRVALEYTVVFGSLSALTRDSFYVWW